MKNVRRLVLGCLATLMSTSVWSQITVSAAQGPQVGDSIPRLVDDNPTFGPGGAGAAQVWNFTNVVRTDSNTTRVIAPSATPYAGYFPASNMAMTTDAINFLFLNFSPTTMTLNGLAGDLLGNGNNLTVPFTPAPVTQEYPVTYGNNFAGAYGFDVTTSGTNWGVYQIRMKRTATTHDTIDAWGTMTTPVGTYNCLRQKHVEVFIDTVWTKLLFFSPWLIYQTKIDTMTAYNWVGEESGLALAEMTFDSAGTPDRFTWTLVPPVPVAQFSWVDNGNGSASFTDLSGNSPSVWSWDFGDGSPVSNLQNPNHPYATNGTYWVCLTVSNVTGINTFCDSVTVTGIVGVASSVPMPTLSIAPNPASGTFEIHLNANVEASEWMLQVYDLQGKRLMQQVITASNATDAIRLQASSTSLAAGVYTLTVMGDGMLLGRGRLVVAR